jgi:hypothetical protein
MPALQLLLFGGPFETIFTMTMYRFFFPLAKTSEQGNCAFRHSFTLPKHGEPFLLFMNGPPVFY